MQVFFYENKFLICSMYTVTLYIKLHFWKFCNYVNVLYQQENIEKLWFIGNSFP